MAHPALQAVAALGEGDMCSSLNSPRLALLLAGLDRGEEAMLRDQADLEQTYRQRRDVLLAVVQECCDRYLSSWPFSASGWRKSFTVAAGDRWPLSEFVLAHSKEAQQCPNN